VEDTMKCNKNTIHLGVLLAIFTLAMITSALVLADHAYAQENKDSVVLVPLIFEKETWSLNPEGVTVLPCAAPTKFIRGTEGDPLIRVLGANKEPVYERQMNNPRLILIEDPREEPSLLDEVSFKIRFKLADGMELFEFWYNPRAQEEPSVTVDLREAIKKYVDAGGVDQEAPCQQPTYVPDQLQK